MNYSKSILKNLLSFSHLFIIATVFVYSSAPLCAATFNVSDYGAIGNDDTDDSIAIQLALDAADGTPGVDTVYIPNGTYIVSDMKIGSNTVLRGQSRINAILKLKDNVPSGTNILTNMDTTNGNADIGIKTLGFDGNKMNQVGSCLHIVNLWNCENLLVKNCEFHNGAANGLVVQMTKVTTSTTIEDCLASNNYSIGIYIQSNLDHGAPPGAARNVDIINCNSRDNLFGGYGVFEGDNIHYLNCYGDYNGSRAGSQGSFNLDSSTNVTYENCYARFNYANGFAAWGGHTEGSRQGAQITYSKCTSAYNNKNGFHLQGVYSVTINGNSLAAGNTRMGITAIASSAFEVYDIRVKDTEVRGNKHQGIYFSEVKNSLVDNVFIHDNSYDNADQFDGAWLGNSEYITIENCDIYNATATLWQRWGVRSVQNSDYLTVINNDLTHNSSGMYLLVGDNNTVYGNN
jgi:hypothetical protein